MTEPTPSSSIPSYIEEHKKLVIAALKHPYVSISSKDQIRTGNGYQSVNLDAVRTVGGRPDREVYVSNLNLTGKSVLDIGANLGEMSRIARRHGASLIDGYEYDQFFVETGRLINAVTGATRVSLFQGDATKPEFYRDKKYDVIFAFSVYVYIQNHLQELASIANAMVFETHTLDHGLDMYLDSLKPHFPAVRVLGYVGGGSDLKKSRAILAFGKTNLDIYGLLNLTLIKPESYFANSFFPAGCVADQSELMNLINDLDLPTGAPLTGLGKAYFTALLIGYREYLEAGYAVRDENIFLTKFREAIAEGRIDKNLSTLLKEPEALRAKIACKFKDLDYAATSAWHMIAPVALTPQANGTLVFKRFDGSIMHALNIDGHHRFFVHQLFKRPVECILRPPVEAKAVVNTKYTLEANQ